MENLYLIVANKERFCSRKTKKFRVSCRSERVTRKLNVGREGRSRKLDPKMDAQNARLLK